MKAAKCGSPGQPKDIMAHESHDLISLDIHKTLCIIPMTAIRYNTQW